MTGDWTAALGILVVAVLWVQIFLDYRRKLTRIMPSVSTVSSRRNEINSQISESESSTQSLQGEITSAQREIAELEERRLELQLQLNPQEMVLVPAGRVRMGSNDPTREDENPEHLVQISAFYIDKTEVTNLQYKEFIAVTGHREPSHWRYRTFPDARMADHPVVNVSWEDAAAYAAWVGKRLPTEAEWERAALGDGRNDYPWGRSCNPECANFDNADGKTTPVERFPRGVSPMGVWDMCGNVSEWVNDWYDNKYYGDSPDTDPPGPTGGHQRVHRGGGYHENRNGIRGKARHFAMASASQEYIGFRCALDEDAAED
jgi:sulfatase modifying factor 1